MRKQHTTAVEQGLLRPLLRQTVVGLGYVVLGDPTNTKSTQGGISAWLSLVFILQDGRQFELGDYSLLGPRDEPQPQFFPLRIDAERLASCGPYWERRGRLWVEPIRSLDPPPPWTVDAISEVWVPMRQGADLLTVILWGECPSQETVDRPALLAIDMDENAPCTLAAARARIEKATLWHSSVLYRLYDPPPRRIKLMADYTPSPLWAEDYDIGHVGNIAPEELPLRSETIARLYAWTALYRSWLGTEAPREADRVTFDAEGVALWQLLREELAGRYVISYKSELDRHPIGNPSDH